MVPARLADVDLADPDDSLVRAQAGDSAAFETILRTHQAMVFSMAYRYFSSDRATAEDVAQDVFLELFRGIARIESPAHLIFWLRRVTANRCIDRLRRHKFEGPVPDNAPEPSAPGDARDFLLDKRIQQMVAELPSHARAVMLLRFQEDLDTAEIARVLAMPVNTVKSHLRRSVEALRRQLSEGESL